MLRELRNIGLEYNLGKRVQPLGDPSKGSTRSMYYYYYMYYYHYVNK